MTIEAMVTTCPHCDHALRRSDLPEIHTYDHIDLPPIVPVRPCGSTAEAM